MVSLYTAEKEYLRGRPSLPKSYQTFSLIYQINNTHTKYTTLYQKAPHVTTVTVAQLFESGTVAQPFGYVWGFGKLVKTFGTTSVTRNTNVTGSSVVRCPSVYKRGDVGFCHRQINPLCCPLAAAGRKALELESTVAW